MPPKSAPKSRKRAASNVGQGVTNKKARKAKQPASDEPDSVEEGEDRGSEKQGKGKAAGKRKARGGKVVAKARGKAGRYVFPCESINL